MKKAAAKAVTKDAERRKGKDRRKKTPIDLIYSRMVARNILPERRKGDRRD